MNLRLITAPAAEPVSLEIAKNFLRVDHSTDDTLITSLIKAAREKGEELSRRAFITQTLEMSIDAWPRGLEFKLLRPPLQSVTSIKYRDYDNAEHTVNSSTYQVNIKPEPGEIAFLSLPGDRLLRGDGPILVQYIAGYGDAAANVPERFKNIILSLVAYWYENRQSQDLPADIKKAFVAERVVWF